MKKALSNIGFAIPFAWCAAACDAEPLQGELRLTSYTSSDEEFQSSLVGKQLYLVKPVGETRGLYVDAYHDPAFASVYVGIAQQSGDLQVGFSAGKARYDATSRWAWNPWFYYGTTDVELFLSVDRYGKEEDVPWYTLGYAHKNLGRLFVGVYGETGLGIGPMSGVYIADNVKLWVSIPLAEEPDEGGMKVILGLVVGF